MVDAFQVGSKVIVTGRRGSPDCAGTLELDNGDGTWSVCFADGHKNDMPVEQFRLASVLDSASYSGRAKLASAEEPKPDGWTRFVCFSDTHGLHSRIPRKHYVEADVLLHAGDFTNTGEAEEVESLAEWLRCYPARHKVVIAGNHDITFQPEYYRRAWRRFHQEPYDCQRVRRALVASGACTYLEDDVAEVLGYRVYGTPWQPEFCDWAFNLPPGDACEAVWAKIPSDVDVLMTHGPPFGRNDRTSQGKSAGCRRLLEAVQARTVPVVVSGHIHASYGLMGDGATLYVNASTCTSEYLPVNPPVVFDLPPASELRRARLLDEPAARSRAC